MERHLMVLEGLEARHAPDLANTFDLICQHLPFGPASALYIAKPHWTNRFDAKRASTIGIFFSIWITADLIEKNRYCYNIHSKKLAKLPGHRLTSRKFSDQFRCAVEQRVTDWPGIKLDYGPGTLLQGHASCKLDGFAESVEKRIRDFLEIHDVIDQLLKAGRVG